MHTTEAKQTFITMRAQGRPYSAIAKKLEVSKQTLINWSRELQGEIANLRAIELESLRTQFKATKEARIRILGKTIAKVEQELDKRDLSELDSEKLVNMLIRLSDMLDKEVANLVFRQDDFSMLDDSMIETVEWTG